MSINLGALREIPPDERAKRMDDAWKKAFSEVLEQDRAPVKFTADNCNPGSTKYLMAVQHGARDNSILISTDGDRASAKWVPLKSKFGKQITATYHSQVEWQEGRLGFLVVMIPGWLAIDREFAQAKSPQLCSGIEWSDEHKAAWAELRKRWNHTRYDASMRLGKLTSTIRRREAF